jgi:hypothetical protein
MFSPIPSQDLDFHQHMLYKSNIGSFSYSVSEEKIFLEINHSETRIACGGHVC